MESPELFRPAHIGTQRKLARGLLGQRGTAALKLCCLGPGRVSQEQRFTVLVPAFRFSSVRSHPLDYYISGMPAVLRIQHTLHSGGLFLTIRLVRR